MHGQPIIKMYSAFGIPSVYIDGTVSMIVLLSDRGIYIHCMGMYIQCMYIPISDKSTIILTVPSM